MYGGGVSREGNAEEAFGLVTVAAARKEAANSSEGVTCGNGAGDYGYHLSEPTV